MSVEAALNKWKELDQAASAAEAELRAAGQLGSDPRAAQLATRAAELRREAEELLAEARRLARSARGQRGPL